MGHAAAFMWGSQLVFYRASSWIIWGIYLDLYGASSWIYMEHFVGLYRACSWIYMDHFVGICGAFSWICIGHPAGFTWSILLDSGGVSPFPCWLGRLFWGGIWDAPSTTDGMLLAAHHPCSHNAVVPRAIPVLIPLLPAGCGWSQPPWVGARCPPGPTHPFPAPCTPPWAGWRCQTPAQASVGLTLSEAQEP